MTFMRVVIVQLHAYMYDLFIVKFHEFMNHDIYDDEKWGIFVKYTHH